MDLIFKFYKRKLFRVQNFSQIRETTIFCPFGVKITNFSKMDLIFKLYAQKLFWVHNFSQIRETTIFCPFCHFGVKITHFSKMDFIFKLYAQKLFWVQNFNQIGETTIFCPFGVKITNFSKIIKCSQNRIDLQIVNTKTVLGAKFQPNQRNYNMLPFLPFQGSKLQNVQKWTSFSNSTNENCSGYKISAKSEKL